jgi:hypothetical protein
MFRSLTGIFWSLGFEVLSHDGAGDAGLVPKFLRRKK